MFSIVALKIAFSWITAIWKTSGLFGVLSVGSILGEFQFRKLENSTIKIGNAKKIFHLQPSKLKFVFVRHFIEWAI